MARGGGRTCAAVMRCRQSQVSSRRSRSRHPAASLCDRGAWPAAGRGSSGGHGSAGGAGKRRRMAAASRRPSGHAGGSLSGEPSRSQKRRTCRSSRSSRSGRKREGSKNLSTPPRAPWRLFSCPRTAAIAAHTPHGAVQSTTLATAAHAVVPCSRVVWVTTSNPLPPPITPHHVVQALTREQRPAREQLRQDAATRPQVDGRGVRARLQHHLGGAVPVMGSRCEEGRQVVCARVCVRARARA